MTFFKRQNMGRVYVIKAVLSADTTIHKIGMVHSARSVDRMMEVLRSWFTQYRFVPYTELRLDMEFPYPRELEQHMHKILAHQQFIPSKKVDGGTELFTDIDEFRVIQYMRMCNSDLFAKPLALTPADYKHLGQLLSP